VNLLLFTCTDAVIMPASCYVNNNMHEKKRSFHWLRAAQFKCYIIAKSVIPVQIAHRNLIS